jgi:hypothetical protein
VARTLLSACGWHERWRKPSRVLSLAALGDTAIRKDVNRDCEVGGMAPLVETDALR